MTLALWMLYHIPGIDRAVAELRRVTRPGGYVVAATNTSIPSYFDELAATAMAEISDHGPAEWLPRLDFNAENGAEILGRSFDSVESHHGRNRFRFTDVDAIVSYIGSMTGPIARTYPDLPVDAFLERIEATAENRIEADGWVDLEQRRAVFICR